MTARTAGLGFVLLASMALLLYWANSAPQDTLSDFVPPVRLSETGDFELETNVVAEAAPGSSHALDGSNSLTTPSTSDHDGVQHPGHSHVEDPTGDLALYEKFPMSSVPHRVARGWGARGAGAVPGVVGAYVIVEADISDDELTELARDIRKYHYDADALSVRILDSQRAATYDRHDDGGEFAAAHLLGTVNKSTHLDIDRIEIRGKQID